MARRSPPVYRDSTDAAPAASASAAPLACDVSFISDQSAPPHATVAREIERLGQSDVGLLYWGVFDSLRAEYERGEFLPHPIWVRNRIRQTLAREESIKLADEKLDSAFHFFDRVNGVMFEQQTLSWLAGSEFSVNLYGAGWESHPILARHARGTIDGDATRLAIYRASRINLAASVYGVVSPKLLEGIGAGGFFILRYCPADLIERFFPPIWEFCQSQGITTNGALEEHATVGIRNLLAFAGRTIGIDVLRDWPEFVSHVRASADRAYTGCAGALFPQYPSVAFSTKDELIGIVGRYLYDVPARQRLAEDMRRQLNARFAHVKVNRRVLAQQPSSSEEIAA